MDKIELLKSLGYSDEFIKHIQEADRDYDDLYLADFNGDSIPTKPVDVTELILNNPHLSGSADFTIAMH